MKKKTNFTLIFKLINDESIAFKEGEKTPFSGIYEEHDKKSSYKNGKLDGKSTWWNKRGQKVRQKNYKNGKLDGKWIEWFQFNGEIKREENYKNGMILF